MPADADLIYTLFQQAREGARTFEWHWQEVADLVLPTRQFTTQNTPGSQRKNTIFDATAPNANDSLAAAVHGFLTNPALRWMELTMEDFDATQDPDVLGWLYDSTNRLLSYFASIRSNFATASHELYLDLGAFGTGVMMLRETPDMLRFLPKQLSGFYVLENEDGTFTHNFRCFELTAREVVREFKGSSPGPSSKVIQMASDPKTAETKVELLHGVYLRDDADPTSVFNTAMPWASIYMEVAQKHVISESGFRESPYLMPRWSKAADESYGRGPAMSVLPAIKGANAIRRDTLIASEQATRPPINVPAGMMEGPISTRPGSINYVRAGTRDMPQPMQLGTQPQMGQFALERAQAEIEEAYFLDVLRLPDRDRMTAEEIITRRQQGLLKASPTVSRLISEWLGHAVVRVFNWHMRTKRLLPMPQALVGRRMKVEYTSPMAQSQKAAGNQNISQAMIGSSLLVQADPSILTNVDGDAAFRAIWIGSGADPRLLRPVRQAKQLRDGLRQQQQLAAQATTARELAAAGKDAATAQREFRGG